MEYIFFSSLVQTKKKLYSYSFKLVECTRNKHKFTINKIENDESTNKLIPFNLIA